MSEFIAWLMSIWLLENESKAGVEISHSICTQFRRFGISGKTDTMHETAVHFYDPYRKTKPMEAIWLSETLKASGPKIWLEKLLLQLFLRQLLLIKLPLHISRNMQ